MNDIQREAIRFFRESTRSSGKGQWRIASSDLPRVGNVEGDQLIMPISEQEVLEAMQNLNAEGSPGPDGF
jgi:hypothetical protein